MKKLFTLIAFLTCFLGAKAELVEVYTIDYSTYNGFPFYVMGYVPEWFDGVMTDFGAMYTYKTEDKVEEGDNVIGDVQTNNGGATYKKIQLESAGWHQYFIADGIPTEIDGKYKVVAMAKASETVTVNVNMGWGWGDGQQAGGSVTIGTDWAEVEWEYSGIAGTSCNLVAQPGTSTATIEWKWLKVYQDKKQERPVTWQQWLTSDGQPIIPGVEHSNVYMGDAETPWADPETRWNDTEKNFLVCAWSKEKGHNLNDDGGWDPFPANIEVDPKDPNNHVFVCHGQVADTEGDPSAWDNQFWIESPKSWKSGDQLKIHFRYMASEDAKTNTQIHNQNPSNYLIWHAIGDITFTTQWQTFDGTMSMGDDMAGGWSIAFNLNAENKNAIDFYFDDLSWESMVLDEGLFVTGTNTITGMPEYDFETCPEFTVDPDDETLVVATIGEKGKTDTYVNQVMISTIRGNAAAFKSNTIKPSGEVLGGEDEWLDYTAASLAKINLPGMGVWKISIAPEDKQINFIMLEGESIEPIEINPNPTEVVVHGQERDWLPADADGNPVEEGVGTGAAWDNQFFIVSNEYIPAGTVTVVAFKYKSSVPATSGTQCHQDPGQYIHWSCIGSFNFTEEWQSFEKTFTIPAECDGSDGKNMKSIAFNMAEIKGACDYYLKDFIWKADDNTKSYINQQGAENFYVKEGAGTSPHVFEGGTGIANVTSKSNTTATATYNIAGQRVSNDYKGLVVKDGKKMIRK